MAGPAPAPTMAAQPTAQPNATYQPAPMARRNWRYAARNAGSTASRRVCQSVHQRSD
jgi:hypothetical protein